MKKQMLGKVALVTGLVLALSACAPVFEDDAAMTNSTAASGDPIQIGALLELSGEATVYGLPAQKVLEIAMKEINAAGGIGGRPLELVYDDGGCDATPAQKAITNLVSVKKVKVVVGALCSSEALTSAPVVNQNKVVFLSTGASSPKITTDGGDFVFRNYPSDSAQGEALADYASTKGYKKVGMLVEEQPYTEGIADAFAASFAKKGGAVVQEKFAKDASDFRTQITKLQAAGVDGYMIDPQAPAKGEIIIKQLQEAGIKGPFIFNDVVIASQKEIITPYKDYIEGSVGAEVPYDKTNPATVKLMEQYKTMTGEDLPYPSYMSPTYDALYIIKEAIEKVGEDPVKIKDYLYTIKGRKGTAGTLSFDANGDPTPEYRHALRIVKGGVVEDFKADAMTK